MTNYYLLENGIITQSAKFQFSESAIATEEEILRDELSGQLFLKSEHETLAQTEEYKAKVSEQENAAKKAELILKIEELDKKRVRASLEPSVKDASTGQTWLEFYNQQITDLRAQITSL